MPCEHGCCISAFLCHLCVACQLADIRCMLAYCRHLDHNRLTGTLPEDLLMHKNLTAIGVRFFHACFMSANAFFSIDSLPSSAAGKQ